MITRDEYGAIYVEAPDGSWTKIDHPTPAEIEAAEEWWVKHKQHGLPEE